jgi:anti-sigma regulatory factor (Ser/Thr protein kinase)
MVSELAMNAVQHARTQFEVSVELTAGTLRVTVIDSGAGRPTAQPMPPPSSDRGRGLQIVRSLADEWGVNLQGHGSGKSVWFQLALQAEAQHGGIGPR